MLLAEKTQWIAAQISAAGYAEFHPVAEQLRTRRAGRKNRRVDIILLDVPETSGFGGRHRLSFGSGGDLCLDAKHLDDDALGTLAVELGVEDALPGAEIETCHG